MKKKPYIICSAIYFNDEKHHHHQPKNVDMGFIVTGRMHHNVYAVFTCLERDRTDYGKSIQGFLTNDNRFVTREEAAKIAFDAGQIKHELEKLYSENIF